jgi:Protein of unknown function (DUF1091)
LQIFENDLFDLMGSSKIRILSVPKFNYCDMRSGLSQLPIISQIFQQMVDYGNAVPKCPIKPGHYFMHGLALEQSAMNNFFPEEVYYGCFQVFEENKKPLQLLKFESHTYNKLRSFCV